VTLVGTTLVLFGGEDAKRCLLNDLHILDLETMTWDDVDAMCKCAIPPTPPKGHRAHVLNHKAMVFFRANLCVTVL